MPEYNFGINAPLKNAIDFLHHEWHDKPVGFVSYGGIAAGTRAVQMTKQIVSALKMVPVYEAVYIPFVASRIHDGRFDPSDVTEDAAAALLDELVRVEAGLHTLRAAHTV
jgi:NAD(P)H-dependent FMN reductase